MGKIIEGLKQNTPEWIEWRKDKIGASDAAAIMGVSKWCTPWQMYMRKLGLIADQKDNAAMSNGREKESEALSAFNEKYGFNCKPVIMQHAEYPWMIASLDGWDAEECVGVEIKCPGFEDHERAREGRVPEHYYPQVQHQLEVIKSSCNGIIKYFSWYKEQSKTVDVWCDDFYQKGIIEKQIDFIRRMKELDPPDLTEKDYVENHSREWRYACENFRIEKDSKEIAEIRYEEAREELIRLAQDHNCKGSGVRLTKSLRKGNIDYTVICEQLLKNLDLEPYRKPPITTWRISQDKS